MARFERVTNGIPHLLVPNECNVQGRLLVTLAAHKGGERYAAAESIRQVMPVDLLGFRDLGNGALSTGMGGRASAPCCAGWWRATTPRACCSSAPPWRGTRRCAPELNACCVVSNPQVSLDAALRHVWRELRENTKRIPHRVNLDEVRWRDRRAVLSVLHGRHPMEPENMRRLLALWLATPGMVLNLIQVDEAKHVYLIRDFPHFRRLCECIWRQRPDLEEQAAAAPA